MLPLVSNNLVPITELCHQHGVRSLCLIGSATDASFDPDRSDLDFLVEFAPHPPGARADAYFNLRDGLKSLLNRPVDLVMVGAISNPYFAASVQASKIPLYAAA